MKPNPNRDQTSPPRKDDVRDAMRPDRTEDRSTPQGDGARQAVRPNDDDDETDDIAVDSEDSDLVEAEEARQDPQDGALTSGSRKRRD